MIDRSGKDWVIVNIFFVANAIIKISILLTTLRIYHVKKNKGTQNLSQNHNHNKI